MHASIRTYAGKGAKELFDVLEKRKSEVETIISQVQGFVSYTLARSGDGGFSVTICQDKAGADESVRVARDWIAKRRQHWRGRATGIRRFSCHSRRSSLT